MSLYSSVCNVTFSIHIKKLIGLPNKNDGSSINSSKISSSSVISYKFSSKGTSYTSTVATLPLSPTITRLVALFSK